MKKIFMVLILAGFGFGAECGNGDECFMKALDLMDSNEKLSDEYILKACEEKNLDACAVLIADDTAPKEKRDKLYNILKDGCLGSAPNMMLGCLMAAGYIAEENDEATFSKLIDKTCQIPMTNNQKILMQRLDLMGDYKEVCGK